MTAAPVPELDLARVDLPSDRVNLGQVRREQPELFADATVLRDAPLRELNISATIATEIQLAQSEFARASGRPDPFPGETREVRIRWLNQDYRRYGISTGMQVTRQLVRTLEDAVRAQVPPRLGR